jgi:GNAT superfamily N-acetyltransferase
MLNTVPDKLVLEDRHNRAIRYQGVTGTSCAWAAAELLRQSWAPPCLYYSDPYVRWQLASPTPLETRSVLVTDGSRPVGYIAAIPRSVWTPDGAETVICVLSLFAVHPDYRGGGIGRALVRSIMEAIGSPTLVYTQPGSSAERLFEASASARGWAFKRIAELRTYAFMRAQSLHSAAAAREATVDEFMSAVAVCPSPGLLWSRPTAEQVKHYTSDPRGSCPTIVHDAEGATLGGAIVVRSEIVTARGVETVPSLDAVFLQQRQAEALGALGVFALDCWAGGAAVVTAPNLSAVPSDAIRSAGFRATRSSFTVAAIGDESDPVVRRTTATNLEVF